MSSEFDLMISPIYSGYRDRETNELHITQFYHRILRIIATQRDRFEHDRGGDGEDDMSRMSRQKKEKDRREPQKDWKDLKIGISLSDVISIRPFDPDLYLESSSPKIIGVHEQ